MVEAAWEEEEAPGTPVGERHSRPAEGDDAYVDMQTLHRESPGVERATFFLRAYWPPRGGLGHLSFHSFLLRPLKKWKISSELSELTRELQPDN